MSVPQENQPAPLVKRRIQSLQVESAVDESKLKRTLASICGFTVNTYIMYLFKAAEGVSAESQIFFHLLALVMLVITVKEKDASYLFTAFAVFFTPYIVLAAGLSAYSIAAILMAITVLGFQRGVTMQHIASGAASLAGSLGQSNVRRKILKLSQSDIEAELLLEDDLTEFTEVDTELGKFKKAFANCKPAMKNALKQTITQVEELQVDHAKVLSRSAGLAGYLQTINKNKLNDDINTCYNQLEAMSDDVARAQLQATIDMKKKRIVDLNQLETSLNRVKMQKMQMREMFSSLMDKMNTLKFTDIITLQASSDDMVKEVKTIRSGLEDLEKGLIEAEQLSRSR